MRDRRLFILLRVLLVCLAVGLASPSAAATSHRSKSTTSSSTKKKTVHVRSYTRKDGTVVRAHDRSAPGTATKTAPAPRRAATSTPAATPSARTRDRVTVGRTADGRIARSEEAKRTFERQSGFPHGRPGYVVDHIQPLACGGADAPANMQWQTIAAAKAKDKTERIGCH